MKKQIMSIMVFFTLLPFVLSINYDYSSHNIAMDITSPNANWFGVQFIPQSSLYIVNATTHVLNDCDIAAITEMGSSSQLTNTTHLAGRTFIFDEQVLLEKNRYYCLVCVLTTGSQNRYYTDANPSAAMTDTIFWNESCIKTVDTYYHVNELLFNFLDIWSYNASDSSSPSLYIYSDLTNGTISKNSYFQFFYNGSSINNSNIYDCNFTIDENLNQSYLNLDLSTQQNFSIEILSNGKWFNFSINCKNENASDIYSALYYIDTKLAEYNIYSPLFNSTYYDSTNIIINFTANDTNLYALLFNISSGNELFYSIYVIGISGSGYNVFNISNSTKWGIGVYNYTLEIWENHNPLTDKGLFSEYYQKINTSPLKSTISYSLNTFSYSISLLNYNSIITYETKDYKQYFNFKPNIKNVSYKYRLESKSKIEYLPDSNYQGHFVIWDYRRYIDFVCDDSVKISKITDFEYEIETKCTNFKTTGNLNYQIISGLFSIIAEPDLTDFYLIELINKTSIQNSLIEDQNEGINMIAYIFLFIIGIILPYVFRTKEQKFLFYVSAIILFFCFIFFEPSSLFGLFCLGLSILYVLTAPDTDENIFND